MPARVMLNELAAHASTIVAAVEASLPPSPDVPQTLGPDFIVADKVSIDIAVMEKTRCASVLPGDFEWSDLGAWLAVKSAGGLKCGIAIIEDAADSFVRVAEGMVVAVTGVSNLAVIAKRDAILACALDRAQEVKKSWPIASEPKRRARVSMALDQLLAAKAAGPSEDMEKALWIRLSAAIDEAETDMSRLSGGPLGRRAWTQEINADDT